MRVVAPGAPPHWWQLKRWWIAILLCLVTTVGSIDRQAMSVAASVIKSEYHISNTQYGALAFAFLLSYGIGQLFAGVLLDRLGTKRALSIAVFWWSLAAMAHALARGFWGFFAARAVLGLTEGANLPGALKAVAEWFPRAERSMATGIVAAGTGLGLVLAPPVAGLLTHYFSWHAAFLVPGAAGLIWLWFWKRQYFLPEAHPTVSPQERRLAVAERIGTVDSALTVRERFALWGHYLRYRETWGLILARFSGDGAFYFFSVWLPLYLQTERGFSVLKVAFIAALPFVTADVGALTGGWLGQRLIRHGWSVNRSRKTLIWAGSLGVLVAFPVSAVDSPWTALALASLAIGSIQVKTSSLFPVAADMYPASDVATVWGMSGAAGSAGAALFQWMFGWLIDAYGYGPVFVIVSLMCVVQAAIVSLLIPRIAPLAFASRAASVIAIAVVVLAAGPAASAAEPRAAPAVPALRDCPDCPPLAVIPRGAFLMGSTDGEASRDEGPVHRVVIRESFALGRYETTIGEFRRFVAATGYRVAPGCRVHRPDAPSEGKVAWSNDPQRSWESPGYVSLPITDDLPVACVGRIDALAYVEWLSRATGHRYRLPSEAEWEYAARGGAPGAWPWGNNPDTACRSANLYDRAGHAAFDFGWSYADCDDGFAEVAPVGRLAANGFGLYDMIGNVWEWTADCFHEHYAGAPTDGRPLVTTEPCTLYSVRGGGWMTRPGRARLSFRGRDPSDARYNYFGFRVARDLSREERMHAAR